MSRLLINWATLVMLYVLGSYFAVHSDFIASHLIQAVNSYSQFIGTSNSGNSGNVCIYLLYY